MRRISYLRGSELRLAFLRNFNSAVLKSQLRRIVLRQAPAKASEAPPAGS